MHKAPIQVEAHPPERRHRQTVMVPCGCCCCCCCCLHTLGGLIGAAVGSIPGRDREEEDRWGPADEADSLSDFDDEDEGAPRRRRDDDDFRRPEYRSGRPRAALPAAGLYWLVLVVLSAASPLWWPLFSRSGGQDAGAAAFFIILLGLPAIQLAASLVAFLLVALLYPDKGRSMLAIGKITLWTVLGSVAGLAIMWGICVFPGLMR